METQATLAIGDSVEAWIAHSVICLKWQQPSPDARDFSAEDALEFADTLLDLSKDLLPHGLESRPSRDTWEKDKNGYFFGHNQIEIWIESRLVIKLKLPAEAQLGPADACRFADVLKHLAGISVEERQELIENNDISMLKLLTRDDAVRDMACRILDRNKPDKSTFNDCLSITYLCQNYPERFDMWCQRYSNHPDGDVLFELAMEARKINQDKAIDLLELAFKRAPLSESQKTNILDVLVSLTRPEDKETAEKARRLFRKLSPDN